MFPLLHCYICIIIFRNQQGRNLFWWWSSRWHFGKRHQKFYWYTQSWTGWVEFTLCRSNKQNCILWAQWPSRWYLHLEFETSRTWQTHFKCSIWRCSCARQSLYSSSSGRSRSFTSSGIWSRYVYKDLNFIDVTYVLCIYVVSTPYMFLCVGARGWWVDTQPQTLDKSTNPNFGQPTTRLFLF